MALQQNPPKRVAGCKLLRRVSKERGDALVCACEPTQEAPRHRRGIPGVDQSAGVGRSHRCVRKRATDETRRASLEVSPTSRRLCDRAEPMVKRILMSTVRGSSYAAEVRWVRGAAGSTALSVESPEEPEPVPESEPCNARAGRRSSLVQPIATSRTSRPHRSPAVLRGGCRRRERRAVCHETMAHSFEAVIPALALKVYRQPPIPALINAEGSHRGDEAADRGRHPTKCQSCGESILLSRPSEPAQRGPTIEYRIPGRSRS